MKCRILQSLWTALLCLSVLLMVPLAQSSTKDQNLSACKNGIQPCDSSELSVLEQSQLDASEHQNNVVDCGNGSQSCDRSQLTIKERVALSSVLHERNFSTCMVGLGTCNL